MEFYTTHISKNAKNHINKILDSTFISAGKVADQFEDALTQKLGLVNPVSVNSGTSALHLALEVAGIGPGCEVILPPQTFIASGLSIIMTGAKPVFADIQYETGNIDPRSIESKITERTRAIMPVHWAGYPCDMDEIKQIAKKYNLVVVEDAAHALGAIYKGRPIGSISDFTCFSFQAIKHLTTGDGGALCCLSDKHHKSVKDKRWFGIDRDNSKPSILGEREYNIQELGYKYHMNDLSASLGLANLEDLPMILRKRRDIAHIYLKELANIPGLTLLDYQNDRESSYWLFTTLVDNRIDFIKKLKSDGIPVSVVHQRIDRNDIFGGKNYDLVNQVEFDKNQISIPIHSGLTDSDVSLILKTIKNGW